MGGYGKTISHVIIGLKTAKGTKQLKVSMCVGSFLLSLSLLWAGYVTCAGPHVFSGALGG